MTAIPASWLSRQERVEVITQPEKNRRKTYRPSEFRAKRQDGSLVFIDRKDIILTDSIPLRQRSKVSVNYYFSQVRSKSHILAQVEALAEYGMSFEDLDKLMTHQKRL